MPEFLYESLTSQGEGRTGVITANDRATAIRQLLDRGETATNILESGGKRTAGPLAGPDARPALRLRRSGRPQLRRTEMSSFMRELATALEAGLPLMQSLRTMRRQASGRAMPVILDHLIERVEAGDPLHVGAKDYGPPFDDMIVGMLRAAEASGQVSEVLHQLADLLERSLELRRDVLGAVLYPMIVAVLIAASATILVTVIVPKLIEPLAGGMRLPWPTEVVLVIANALSSYWIHTIIIGTAIWLGWRTWVNAAENREIIDRLKLRLPIIGPLLRDVAVARFTRTLGTLASAGLPILDALRITRNTLGNRALMRAIDEVQDQVTSGKSLADPLERSGLFPPLLVQVVNLGERSGRLESMLLHAAKAFDRQVNTSIKLFSKALPPLLLVVMAAMGGFLLAAILLPLLELQSMVG